jgi:hypothetical protein
MRNTPEKPSEEFWIVIGIFILMLCLKFLPKGLENTSVYCNSARSCPADPAGLGTMLDPRLYIILLAPVGYWIAFALEVGFLASFLTRRRISPYFATALGIGIFVLSYVIT